MEYMNSKNVCVFAYGPTGSGKSWTMLGNNQRGRDNGGIIPRSVETICKNLSLMDADGYTNEILVSVVEIYNGKIQDLIKRMKTSE